MHSRIRALFLAMTALLMPAVATAKLPFPPMCTLPGGILLVGSSGGTADALGEFSVTVRNLAGQTEPDADVVVDFSGCGARACPGTQAAQPFPGMTADCATHTVREFTDPQGTATFRVTGASAGGAESAGRCATIYADGVVLCNVPVAAFDRDGSGGLGANDLALWLTDYFSGRACPSADFDFSGGALGPNDLSLWLRAWNANGSTSSASALCIAP